MSDSASAKIAVVVGIGAVAIGLAALRTHLHAPPVPPKPERHLGVATSVTPTPPTHLAVDEPPTERPRPKGPTQADRVALLEASSEGDLGRVEALARKGVNLDGTLGNAAKSGNAALVSWLLAHGVDPKEDEDLAVPPLLQADEHDAVVSLLLAKGAHEPTLAKAVAVEAPKAVRRLFAKGASASAKSPEGEPVLMIAIRDGAGAKRRAVVDALLAAGADVNVKYDDETPLGLALASNASDDSEKKGDRTSDLLAKVVAHGAKVDGDALISALHLEEERRGEVLEVLLSGKLERDATARALEAAVEGHDLASIKRLGAKGVLWSTLDTSGSPPLASAIIASDVAMVRVLLDVGAPMDRMGEDGDTALLVAVTAAAGDSDDALRVVRVLLERGASPNKRGRDGRTALFAAAQQGSDLLVALLVSKGARVEDAVDGMTPIEAADARGNEAVVKILRARGARLKVARND